MKIGVVSDTHSFDLPRQMIEDFRQVDLILHAGDFCSTKDYTFFKRIQKVRAVYGNVDEAAICRKLPAQDIFEVEGVRIGMIHGAGTGQGVLTYVKNAFRKERVDVVVFGHTHQPCQEYDRQTLYFNPGSPNDYVRAPYCSYGILEVRDKTVKGKIIKVEGA